jgi:4'-phosphopantetheinyl transferase
LSPRFDRVLGSLASEEQERARRYRFETDRRRYLGETLLQRLVLAHYLSCPFRDLSFSRNQWGKPSLDRKHDAKIRFSLSRSHEVAILAVSEESEESEVGADLEYALGRNSRNLSVRRYFSDEEQDFIENAPDSRKAFFEIWDRKEACIKGIGRGLSHPLAEFDVTPGEPTGETIVRDWSGDCPDKSWRVRSVSLSVADYPAAIATISRSLSLELFESDREELLARKEEGEVSW